MSDNKPKAATTTSASGAGKPYDPLKWHRKDTVWMLSLFGTAVGAGVLFLPIDAGGAGGIGLLFMAIISYPMAYFAHLALSRFVLSADRLDDDITDVVEQRFGFNFGMVFTILYFIETCITLLVYAISITNTVESFIGNQLHLPTPPRWLLSLILITALVGIASLGIDVITKVVSALVYPVIIVLVLFSLYLIPKWNMSMVTSYPKTANGGFNVGALLENLWLLIPVMIFAFDHSAIVSSFSVAERKEYGDDEVHLKIRQILRWGELLMVGVVMFFVISCDLSLTPGDLALAKSQNVSILTYIANKSATPFISWVAPIISFVAIAKSFLGNYSGTKEGLGGIIRKAASKMNRTVSKRGLMIFISCFVFLIDWLVAWANPSVMDLLETMVGPIIAFILFLMPMYAIHKVPSLKKYAGRISNVFIVVVGLVGVSAIFYNIVKLF
ncbi:hypothetical protein OZX73_02825 [Bifidobacterium sp. ESL0775]|uniref:hypothetical protein n=1 Tax=Bifidobacterium sp. ESL0775 TaxID=2983230 RepID=UPI0023FA4548|nr:hypothetical protein [Bifidobacterium sp. ESL0775]WEV69819.1 hypothetical protein OZX73_02825 [Bifidobacterium sp. ESL0775]